MNADGKSDGSVVPTTQTNKAETGSAAESVEERDPAKRNTSKNDLHRTPSRNKRRSFGLAGVRETARLNPELKFTALLHHINEDLLTSAFFDLKKNAAVGVDEVTWTVTNMGTVAATNNNGWVDRVFFSADREFGGITQRAVGEATRDTTLLPGESYTASTTITLPEDFEGGFWTYVRADAEHGLFENAGIDDNTRRSDGVTNVYAEARAIDQAPSLSLSPSDQSRFPTGTSLALTGSAVAENQSINAFFLFDVSASTLGSTGLDSNGDGVSDALDDFNGDGNVGDVLDTEIASILRLTEQLTTTSDDVRVSSIIFANSAELIDAGPADLGQFSADPLAESTFRPGPGDFETAIRSVGSNSVSWFRQANVIFGTSFSPAIAELQNSLAVTGLFDVVVLAEL